VTVRSLNVRKREVDVVAMVVVVTVKPNVTTTILGRRVTRAISRTLRSKRAVRIKLYIERWRNLRRTQRRIKNRCSRRLLKWSSQHWTKRKVPAQWTPQTASEAWQRRKVTELYEDTGECNERTPFNENRNIRTDGQYKRVKDTLENWDSGEERAALLPCQEFLSGLYRWVDVTTLCTQVAIDWQRTK